MLPRKRSSSASGIKKSSSSASHRKRSSSAETDISYAVSYIDSTVIHAVLQVYYVPDENEPCNNLK